MRIIQIIRQSILSAITFTPFFALAQGVPKDLQGLIGRFVDILDALIPALFGVALIGFLWGVAKTILQADNEDKRKDGRLIMIYGIIGLFVMTAVWGIVLIVGGTFGISFVKQLQTPQFPSYNSSGGFGGGSSGGSSGRAVFDYFKDVF